MSSNLFDTEVETFASYLDKSWGGRPFDPDQTSIDQLMGLGENVDNYFRVGGFRYDPDSSNILNGLSTQPRRYNCLSKAVLAAVAIEEANGLGLGGCVEVTENYPLVNGSGRVQIHGETAVWALGTSDNGEMQHLDCLRLPYRNYIGNVTLNIGAAKHSITGTKSEPFDDLGTRMFYPIHLDIPPFSYNLDGYYRRHETIVLDPVSAFKLAVTFGGVRSSEAEGDYTTTATLLAVHGSHYPAFGIQLETYDPGAHYARALRGWHSASEPFSQVALAGVQNELTEAMNALIVTDGFEGYANHPDFNAKHTEATTGIFSSLSTIIGNCAHSPELRKSLLQSGTFVNHV